MVDFIRMGLLELCGSRVERELQNIKFLPTVGFEPGTSRLLSELATTELRRLMTTDWIKVHLVLPVLFLEISVFVFKFRTRPCVQNVFHEEHMCSSAAHWKCSILQNTFKVFNICCIVGAQIVFYTWTHVLEHMQTFST